MTTAPGDVAGLAPIDQTLTRVVLLMRLLGWAWLMILASVALTSPEDPSTGILVATMALATVGSATTVVAARRGFLGQGWYVLLDGALTLVLAASGWVADYSEFVTGGYPASWLFIVAYATNLKLTTLAGVIATAVYAVLHTRLELQAGRTVGSLQFIVFAVVVGWAFDALREREQLRIEAENERAMTEIELAEQREKTGRLQERTNIARELHDSVLQTLKLISSAAEDPAEVRYLTRVQERDLRRTIYDYQSPFSDSFRARLLDARDRVEDRFRVEIEQVINTDGEMDERLRAVVDASAEAMTNAATHSGARRIDLFAETRDNSIRVSIRDRGHGFDPARAGGGISHSIVERLAAVGGTAEIKSQPGLGTQVQINLPVE